MIRNNLVVLELSADHDFKSSVYPKGAKFDRVVKHVTAVLTACVDIDINPISFATNTKRIYSNSLFIKEDTALVSYRKRTKLLLVRRSGLRAAKGDETSGGLFRVFLNVVDEDAFSAVVDGRRLKVFSREDVVNESLILLLKKEYSRYTLILVKTLSGFEFLGLIDPTRNIYALTKGIYGLFLIKVHNNQSQYVRVVTNFGLVRDLV